MFWANGYNGECKFTLYSILTSTNSNNHTRAHLLPEMDIASTSSSVSQPGVIDRKGKGRALNVDTGDVSSHDLDANSHYPPARESERWTAANVWRESRRRAQADRTSWDYSECMLEDYGKNQTEWMEDEGKATILLGCSYHQRLVAGRYDFSGGICPIGKGMRGDGKEDRGRLGSCTLGSR